MQKSKCLFDRRLETPKITIAIPTFNRPTELQECLRSVRGQTVLKDAFHVLVINNSQDEVAKQATRKVIDEFTELQLAYFENESNVGMFGNWNACISQCQTPYMSILNDDDRLAPNFLAKMLPLIDGPTLLVSRAKIVGSNYSMLQNVLKTLYLRVLWFFDLLRQTCDIGPAKFLSGNTIHASLGIIFSTEAARSLAGFDERKFPAADLVFSHLYALRYGVLYEYRELSEYHWGNNASLRPEIAAGQIIQEFRLRSWYLRQSEISKHLLNLGRYWSLIHLKSKYLQMSLSHSEKLDLHAMMPLIKKIPDVNIRIVYIGWKLFEFAIYFDRMFKCRDKKLVK